MCRKLCIMVSFVFLLSLTGMAGAAEVVVYENETFYAPWVGADPCTIGLTFSLQTGPGDVNFAHARGPSWLRVITDSNLTPLNSNAFLDMDIYCDTMTDNPNYPGAEIMAISIEIPGEGGWETKWQSSSECSVEYENFRAMGGEVALTADTWQHFKIRLETNYDDGDWPPPDPCIGEIRIQGSNPTSMFLDNVKFTNVPTPGAYGPSPSDGAKNVSHIVTLDWEPGLGAVTHNVYLSTDETMVINRTAPMTPVVEAVGGSSLDVVVNLAETYYWAVDEDDGTPPVAAGTVYEFSTVEFLMVENFNGYNDHADMTTLSPGDNQFWYSDWQYGCMIQYQNTDPSLASDGNSLYADYITDSVTYHYYGDALCTFSDGNEQDWSNGNGGIKALSVEMKGVAENDGESIYLYVEDSSTAVHVSSVGTDPCAVKEEEVWTVLNFDLSEFSSVVDLNSVKKFAFRVGDGLSTPPGGIGDIYLDNVKLHPQRCVSSLVIGDLTNDCTVNGLDLNLMALAWLYDPCANPKVVKAPPAQPPLAHYDFNLGYGGTLPNVENPGTYNAGMYFMGGGSPGNDTALVDTDYWNPGRRDPNDPNEADPEDPNFVWDPNGYDANCLDIDIAASGDARVAVVPPALFSNINNSITISVWLAGDPCEYPSTGWHMVFQGEYGGPPLGGQHMLMAIIPLSSNDQDPNAAEWRAGDGEMGGDEQGGATNQLLWLGAADYPESWMSVPWNDESTAWNHWAFVKNAGIGFMRIYWNGYCVATANTKYEGMAGVGEFIIGSSIDRWTDHQYRGKIDEFRIYDYALSQAEVMYLADIDTERDSCDLGTPAADLNGDDEVNHIDYAMQANNWLKTIMYP